MSIGMAMVAYDYLVFYIVLVLLLTGGVGVRFQCPEDWNSLSFWRFLSAYSSVFSLLGYVAIKLVE